MDLKDFQDKEVVLYRYFVKSKSSRRFIDISNLSSYISGTFKLENNGFQIYRSPDFSYDFPIILKFEPDTCLISTEEALGIYIYKIELKEEFMKKQNFEQKFVKITKVATLEHDQNHDDSHVAIGQTFIGKVLLFSNELILKEKKLFGKTLTFTVKKFLQTDDIFETNSGRYQIIVL